MMCTTKRRERPRKREDYANGKGKSTRMIGAPTRSLKSPRPRCIA